MFCYISGWVWKPVHMKPGNDKIRILQRFKAECFLYVGVFMKLQYTYCRLALFKLHNPDLVRARGPFYAGDYNSWLKIVKPTCTIFAFRCLFAIWRLYAHQGPWSTLVNALSTVRCGVGFRYGIFKWIEVITFMSISNVLYLGEWRGPLLIISQYWFRWWLGAVRHQAITWTNVD